MTSPKAPKEPIDYLSIRLGTKFKGSAKGKLSITILGLVVLVILSTPAIVAQLWT